MSDWLIGASKYTLWPLLGVRRLGDDIRIREWMLARMSVAH